MLLSAFLLTNPLLTPAHVRLPQKATPEIAVHQTPKLPLWRRLRDPAQQMREAADCMVSATVAAECIPLLEQALAANSRNTQAALWLALIAAHEGDVVQDQHWLRYARQRDGSFSMLWCIWQMALTAPGSLVPPPSDTELILMAPAGSRGHFPLLLERGWDAATLFALLLNDGRPAQSHGFLQFLIDSQNPKGADLLQATLEAGAGTGYQGFPCSAMVRQFVRQGIRGDRPRESAAHLWSLAVGLRSPACGSANTEVLPNKRSQQGQDPLWNYNPTIRFPLIPESFDWSIAHQDGVFATPDVRGGVQFHLGSPSRHPVILLARPLPPIAEGSKLAITTQWEQFPPNACVGSLTWELRDGAGAAIFGRAPLELFAARPNPLGQAATVTLNLALSAGVEGLQLVLVHYPAAQPECLGESLVIRSVIVQTPMAFSGQARTARQ